MPTGYAWRVSRLVVIARDAAGLRDRNQKQDTKDTRDDKDLKWKGGYNLGLCCPCCPWCLWCP